MRYEMTENVMKETGVPYRELCFYDWCNEFAVQFSIRKYPQNTHVAFQDDRSDWGDGINEFTPVIVYILAKAPHENVARAINSGGLHRLSVKIGVFPDKDYLTEATSIFNQWNKENG